MANYDPIIQEAAQKYNVDPALIRGVIATESAGNPNAASGVGATGLMQIMPSNYKALGITDPKDPTQNIMGGTKLLSQLLDRFGDPVTALRHYQGGDDQTKWGPVNAAYPSKVLAAGGISMPSKQTTPTLPGIPTSQPSAAQSDDQIFAAFAKGAAPAQGGQGVQSDDAIFAALMKQPVQTAAPPAAQAAPQAPQPAQAPGNQPGAVMSFLAGLGHGVQETALGAQQLLGHGAQAVGLNNVGNWLVNDANQGLARGNAEYAPYQAAHPIAAGAGNSGRCSTRASARSSAGCRKRARAFATFRMRSARRARRRSLPRGGCRSRRLRRNWGSATCHRSRRRTSAGRAWRRACRGKGRRFVARVCGGAARPYTAALDISDQRNVIQRSDRT